MEWYIKVLKQFSDFKTRARRKEYWMFTLFSVIISGILTLIDNNLGLAFISKYRFVCYNNRYITFSFHSYG